MEFHEAANAFPLMDERRFTELVEDIKANGQIQPVTVVNGKILDGRNRWRACEKLGIECKTREVHDVNPWDFVWSLNGSRRDLTSDQRYLIWRLCKEESERFIEDKGTEIEKEKVKKQSAAAKRQPRSEDGRRFAQVLVQPELEPDKEKEPGRKARAEEVGVSVGTVARADWLHNNRPDLAEKVRAGEMRPTQAYRQMKRDEVADKVAKLPDGQFTVVYADPPWKYGDERIGLDEYGPAERHYPTMPLSELKALEVPTICAPDCVLFLWATVPLLPDALELCQAWGFVYKSQFVWDKVRHNVGSYVSVRHELLLICTKGSCTPEVPKLFDSVQVVEKSRKHSEKPEEFRDIINTLYPNGKKIELFRRGDKPQGWEVWGNEC